MMNLDEAISHARETAEENKKAASRFAYPDKAGTTKESADCLECAKEHEQLAEWLMELKKLREENVNQFLNSKDIILALIEENIALRKQRPQGDLISRSELTKAINDFYDKFFDGCFSSALITYAKGVDEIIENAQPIEPTIKPICKVKFDKEQLQEIVDKAKAEVLASIERPHGEWIKVKEERMSVDMSGEIVTRYKCSECGRLIAILTSKLADYPFCHCGAEMKKGGAV